VSSSDVSLRSLSHGVAIAWGAMTGLTIAAYTSGAGGAALIALGVVALVIG